MTSDKEELSGHAKEVVYGEGEVGFAWEKIKAVRRGKMVS